MLRVSESVCRADEGKSVSGTPVDEAGLCPLARQFAALGRSYGFDFFLIGTFPNADKPEFAANLRFSNWPVSLKERYSTEDPFASSQLVTRLKQSIVPFHSDASVFVDGRDKDGDMALAAAFKEAGLGSSLAFSMHDAGLAHYVFVFSGDRAELDRQEVTAFYFECLELLDACSARIAHKDGPREKLSAREIECLRWSAAGKSSDEIAIILSISSHTVVSYLKSAMRKLDSVNRMQAVARACRFRLL
ncbi:MAG: LuxR C-terminal-related transcriptional regulator [Allorhizobium sp.]